MVLDVILADTRKEGAAARSLDTLGQQARGQKKSQKVQPCCHPSGRSEDLPPAQHDPTAVQRTKPIGSGSNMLPICRPSKQRPDSHLQALHTFSNLFSRPCG